MKRVSIVIVALLAIQGQAQVRQTQGKGPTSEQLKRDSAEAAGKLKAARESGVVEQDRLSESREREGVLADKAKRAATDLLRDPDPVEAATARRADASMAAAMKNVTAQGKAILAQSAARGPTSAPPRPDVVDDGRDASAAPKPTPIKSVPVENPAVPGSKVLITCTGAAFFDSETSIALFTDNVEVRHPQFFVQCDEFEVHMVKEEKTKEPESGKKVDPIKDPLKDTVKPAPAAASGGAGDTAPGADSSIKFAIARGRMVTIEKRTETGEIQIGHAKHATYDGATGNILLRDFPQVQRGQNLQIATDPSTTMLLKQNGALETKGPSRTEIIQDAKPKSPTRLNTPAPELKISPNPTSSPRQPTQ